MLHELFPGGAGASAAIFPSLRGHRNLLVGLACCLAMTSGAGAAPAARPPWGLQLWSLRDEVKKSGMLPALDIAKQWGFTEVETAGTGELTLDQYIAALKARGLKPVAMHTGYDRLEKELDAVIAEARALGVSYVVVPWIPHERGKFDVELAKKAAANFNKWGAACKAAGFRFGYHPHGYEFSRTGGPNDERVFDLMIAATNSDTVCLEMDVFWVYHSGIDPVAMLKKYPGRWELFHVKDIRKGALRGIGPGTTPGSAPPTDNVAVGDGEIDWVAVLSTAEKLGAKHWFVEDETVDALKYVPVTMKYLRALKF